MFVWEGIYIFLGGFLNKALIMVSRLEFIPGLYKYLSFSKEWILYRTVRVFKQKKLAAITFIMKHRVLNDMWIAFPTQR